MAATLVWQERFSVGVKGLDRQHRELVARANAVFEALAGGVSGEELESLVGLLMGYVHTHFGCEERLMRRHAYPGYARHLAEHQRLLDELAWIGDEYGAGLAGEARVAATARFVASWVSDHFEHADRAFAEHLRAGGAFLHWTTPDDAVGRVRSAASPARSW